ncbi:MAG: imidazoleglycerol-phosphate dehydratase HisB [Treponema sp.]|nr:imidazoleglycerol-phosphate dehydratase HisB [Treponema sp.]
MARIGEVSRQTRETDIFIRLNLDGTGETKILYPIGFMGHMLNTFARHGLFDVEIKASGDLEVDQHHLVEDTGIVLGQCFAKALGDRRGIRRVGSCLFPMDETLARAAADISGRPFLFFEAEFSGSPMIAVPRGNAVASGFQTETIRDFWQGFVTGAGVTLHLDVIRGQNDHHKIEALFKAAAHSFRDACDIDLRSANFIPSTKGILV